LRGGFFIFSSIGEAVSNTKKRDLTAPLTFILSRKGREGRKKEIFFKGFLPIDGGG
jgi:hypothetical protein